MVERHVHDRKIASLNHGRSIGRNFFSRVNFLCWLLFSVRSTPCYHMWHVKDPGHSAKSANIRLHPNMHTPLTQRSRSGLTVLSSHYCGNLAVKRAQMQLIREHLATVLLARGATVDWSLPENWNRCAWADPHYWKIKNAQAGNETLPKNPRKWRKSHHHHNAVLYLSREQNQAHNEEKGVEDWFLYTNTWKSEYLDRF